MADPIKGGNRGSSGDWIRNSAPAKQVTKAKRSRKKFSLNWLNWNCLLGIQSESSPRQLIKYVWHVRVIRAVNTDLKAHISGF